MLPSICFVVGGLTHNLRSSDCFPFSVPTNSNYLGKPYKKVELIELTSKSSLDMLSDAKRSCKPNLHSPNAFVFPSFSRPSHSHASLCRTHSYVLHSPEYIPQSKRSHHLLHSSHTSFVRTLKSNRSLLVPQARRRNKWQNCPITNMSDPQISFDIDNFQSRFSLSPLLHRFLTIHNTVNIALNLLSEELVQQLRKYYNYALIRRRRVVADVSDPTWQFDLAASLSAVIFAREQMRGEQFPTESLHTHVQNLVSTLTLDVSQEWFLFATNNSRRPAMVAMPSLPGINLGVDEERIYIQAVSDTWPTKTVSTIEGDVLTVSSHASCHFIDNVVMGDLGGLQLQLSEAEQSYISGHSIGWVSRYESSPGRIVTIIEIDPRAQGELHLDLDARQEAYKLVKVGEQRLDMYNSLSKKMLDGEWFNDNLILSRLLAIDMVEISIEPTTEIIDVRRYVHVNGAGNTGLGPVDEEVFLKSLGSITAKNKLRSALAVAAKTRLMQLRDRGEMIRDIPWDFIAAPQSRLIRCGVDGIYVRTNIPVDTIFLTSLVVAIMISIVRILIDIDGMRNTSDAITLGIVIAFGLSFSFHHLRYKSWSVSEAVRLRRMCRYDEEMMYHMSEDEVISTIADAGASGMQMDGILTCPYSDSKLGRFSVTNALKLESGHRVGLKIRLNTALEPVWVDYRGVRAVERRELWHVYGPYVQISFLDFTMAGPAAIGSVDNCQVRNTYRRYDTRR